MDSKLSKRLFNLIESKHNGQVYFEDVAKLLSGMLHKKKSNKIVQILQIGVVWKYSKITMRPTYWIILDFRWKRKNDIFLLSNPLYHVNFISYDIW